MMLDFLRPNILLEKKKSKYNGTIEVWRSWGLGVYITSGGLTQSGGILNTIWKSTLREIRSTKSEIRNVLILGLGGGTVAKWVRKYWPGCEITGVEIDPVMIELGTRHLGLENSEIKTVVEDAFVWLKTKNQRPKARYDLIIVDLYQGNEIPAKFKTDGFIQMTRTILVSQGIVVFNRLYYQEKKKEALEFGKKLEEHFSKVECFYPQANLMLICR